MIAFDLTQNKKQQEFWNQFWMATTRKTEHRYFFYGGAVRGGKLLPLNTPIVTPTGWREIGELNIGDQVLDADGKICKVTWVSPVETETSAWKFIFDDGTEIVSDERHQWVTLTYKERVRQHKATDYYRNKRKEWRKPRGKGKRPDLAERNRQAACLKETIPLPRGNVRTTKEIVDTLRDKHANHCIVNCSSLELPEADLLIKPYTLGAWLGDGTSVNSQLTGLDKEVWEAIEAEGYEIYHRSDPKDHWIAGLNKPLRILNLKNNKHIPQQYLRASINQRIELLQGLCDTDGYCCKDKGSIEFTTTSERLKDGFLELVYSLGIKPSCREGKAVLNGRYISKKWRIQFWFNKPCFKIKRKLERQKMSKGMTRNYRTIVDAVKMPSEPMRCIAVDSPSSTYLCGKEMIPTHNTSLCLAIIYFLARKYKNSRWHILRESFTDLEDTTIPSWDKFYAGSQYVSGVIRSKNNYHVSFSNGSKVFFKSESFIQDPLLSWMDGLETNGIFLEQMEGLSEQCFNKSLERIGSWYIEDMPIPVLLGTFNPTQTWAKHKIYLNYKKGTLDKKYLFVEALPTDNPFVTQDQWEAWQMMDSISYKQRIEGDWDAFESASAWAYAFKEVRHTASLELNIGEPLYISFDFNHSPVSCTIWQHYDDKIRCLYELGTSNGLMELCRQIRDLIGWENNELKRITYVTGDKSGWNKSELLDGNRTAYDMILSELGLTKYQVQAPVMNPNLLKSRELTNSILEKHPDFLIDNVQCPNLIYDLKFVESSDKHEIVKDRNKREGKSDYLDTLRYYLNTYHQDFVRL